MPFSSSINETEFPIYFMTDVSVVKNALRQGKRFYVYVLHRHIKVIIL